MATGDRVRFSASYLRQVERWGFCWSHLCGTVEHITALPADPYTIIRVRWDDGEVSRLLPCDLVPA